MSEARFLGVDFSGGAEPWRASCRNPAVWVATLEGFRLEDLRPVQHLAGDDQPFDRLVTLLGEGRFRAAAIDAPFGLPARHTPEASHRRLLEIVGAMPPAEDRPFPRGETLLALAQSVAPLEEGKPSRETERGCGANARSSLWNGARPGAPFAAACLTLLARAQRPMWPWKDEPGMLVEGFPAAQLKAWSLPNHSYNTSTSDDRAQALARRAQRKLILDGVLERTGFEVSREHARLMTDSADALDAFIVAFAGRAAANRQLRFPKPAAWRIEGAIAIHD